MLQVALCQYFDVVIETTIEHFCDFIARDESEVVIHSDDAFAPVGFLHFKRMHVEQKELKEVCDDGCTVFQLILTVLFILTEHNWCTWEYWPKVITVGTKTIKGNVPQYSSNKLLFIIYGIQAMLVY